MVGGEDQGPGLGHVRDPNRPHAVDQQRRQRDEGAYEGVGPADALAGGLVELVEVLGGTFVFIDLWLHVCHSARPPPAVATRYPHPWRRLRGFGGRLGPAARTLDG